MKRRYLRLLPVLFLFLVVLIPLSPSNGWKIWGQELPDGSGEIQVFWYSQVNKQDFRIPQDINLLELDEFTVWFRFTSVDSINFTVQIYDYSVYTRTKIDPENNETYTTQVQIYDILKDSKTFNVSRGQGVNDRRFGVAEINQDNIPSIRSTNVTQLVQLICKGMIIEFYHRTNPAEIEITKRAKEWNMELTGAIMISLIMIMGFIVVAVHIRRRLGRAPKPPKWYFWPFLAGFFFLIYVAFMLLQGLTMEIIMRDIIMIPWVLIPATFGVYLVFYLLDKFSSELESYFFLTIKMIENKLRIGPYELYGYRRKGKLELTIEPDSWSETIKKLFTGGFRLPDEVVNPAVRIDSDNPSEFPHVFAVESCDIQPAKIKRHNPSLKVAAFTIGSFVFMILPFLVDSASLMTAILTSILFIASLMVLVVNSITFTVPSLKITPLTHRSQVGVITDARAIDSIKNTLQEVLKNWGKERAQMSADSLKYIKYALTEYESTYKGIDTKELDLELDEETIKTIKDIKKTLKWGKSKKIIKELEDKIKDKDSEPYPMPED